MPNCIHIHIVNRHFILRLATGLRRQAQARDDKAGAWTRGTSTPLHGQPTRRAFPCFSPSPLACTYPAPRVSPVGAEDDDGKFDGDAERERERDIEGRLPYQHDLEPDEHGSSRVADGGGGTANAHGWHDCGSHSW